MNISESSHLNTLVLWLLSHPRWDGEVPDQEVALEALLFLVERSYKTLSAGLRPEQVLPLWERVRSSPVMLPLEIPSVESEKLKSYERLEEAWKKERRRLEKLATERGEQRDAYGRRLSEADEAIQVHRQEAEDDRRAHQRRVDYLEAQIKELERENSAFKDAIRELRK